MNRRNFIKSSFGASLILSMPSDLADVVGKYDVKISIITDLHQDIVPDGLQRMYAFENYVKKIKPDAILQMGDFAYPGEKNKAVIEKFKRLHKTALHVIGNHDTDAGYSKQQCIDYWGMPGRYYVQKLSDLFLVVLDCNESGSLAQKGQYPSFIAAEQAQWLKRQLNTLPGPFVIISHQPIAGPIPVDNASEIQDILSAASKKILLAINGHTHIDEYVRIKNVNYVHINSASYFWVGKKYNHLSYDADTHKKHPLLANTCPYKDPLFTTLTISPKKKKVFIEGRKVEWLGSSPAELGFENLDFLSREKKIEPEIKARHFSL